MPYLIPKKALPEGVQQKVGEKLEDFAIVALLKKAIEQLNAEVARTAAPQAGVFELKERSCYCRHMMC